MESISNPGYVWAFGFNNGSYREHLDDGTKKFRGWAVRDVVTQCADGIDNDGDGLIDMDDRNCCSASDDDELEQDAPRAGRLPQCSDKIDNDGDDVVNPFREGPSSVEGEADDLEQPAVSSSDVLAEDQNDS